MTHFIHDIGIYLCRHICEAPKTARVSKLSEVSVNCVGNYITRLLTLDFHYLGLANVKERVPNSLTGPP